MCVCVCVCVCVPAVVVGGIDMMSQALVLAKKPHVVIGKSFCSLLVFSLQWRVESLLNVVVL